MKITPELLKKYASEQCSEHEKQVVEQWLQTSQTEEEVTGTADFLEEKIWTNIKKAVDADREIKRSVFQKKTIGAMAASIALLIGLGIILKQSPSGSDDEEKFMVCHTGAGEMKNITLSDGTVVYLNANSSIKIPRKFTSVNRMISFIGEGYFEVRKDSLHPFTIQTQKSETTVLGTKFNLSAYAEEAVTLTLEEGKVSFKGRNNTAKAIMLLPDEQAVLDDESLTKTSVNTKYAKGWLNNILYFNNESFVAITHKIERMYGVVIQIKNPELENQIYKGEFTNPDIETLLDDLSFVLKFKYEIKKNHITIY